MRLRYLGRKVAQLFMTLLGIVTPRGREAAVVTRDVLGAEPRSEAGGDPLGHLPRVDEDERRSVLAHENRHPLVDLVPHLVRADGREGRRRNLDREVEIA